MRHHSKWNNLTAGEVLEAKFSAPCPYRADPTINVSIFGNDRFGQYGGWVSIGGEWVKLDEDEIFRLMKKRNQAISLRMQWESEGPGVGLKSSPDLAKEPL